MIFLASDADHASFKNRLARRLQDENLEFEDLGSGDVFDLSCRMAKAIRKDPQTHRGIFIDSWGALPFVSASKFPSVICALCSDEHSAKMTRDHNNANMIALGMELVGPAVAQSICSRFLSGRYSKGRHQIRLDMLEAMCHEEQAEKENAL